MSEFSTAFPNSRKTFVDGAQGVRVPMREIAIEDGKSSVRVYDTSGPQDHDVKDGLPKLREPWVNARLTPSRLRSPETEASFGEARRSAFGAKAARSETVRCVTQRHDARKGAIPPAMEFVADREGLPAVFGRDEVARGRAIIPSNINHLELEPMIICLV
jgi:phosphomethylpyrimidine synthase